MNSDGGKHCEGPLVVGYTASGEKSQSTPGHTVSAKLNRLSICKFLHGLQHLRFLPYYKRLLRAADIAQLQQRKRNQ